MDYSPATLQHQEKSSVNTSGSDTAGEADCVGSSLPPGTTRGSPAPDTAASIAASSTSASPLAGHSPLTATADIAGNPKVAPPSPPSPSLPSLVPSWWNASQTARMALFGLLLSGPSLHLWFTRLAVLLPGTHLPAVLLKMALGQLLYGPLFVTAFFSGNAALQGALWALNTEH